MEVTAGNIQYDQLCEQYPEHKTVVADGAYKTPWICKRIFESGRVLSAAYKRPMIRKGGHEWWKYVYDEYFNCVICPEYKTPRYATTNRNGYREYRSKPYICARRPTRERRLANTKYEKTVTRHIWADFIERAEDARHTSQYRDLYRLRQEKMERIFADAKEKYGMRYTLYRGLTQVSNWAKLQFAAMNLKKLAMWKWKASIYSLISHIFNCKYDKTLIPA